MFFIKIKLYLRTWQLADFSDSKSRCGRFRMWDRVENKLPNSSYIRDSRPAQQNTHTAQHIRTQGHTNKEQHSKKNQREDDQQQQPAPSRSILFLSLESCNFLFSSLCWLPTLHFKSLLTASPMYVLLVPRPPSFVIPWLLCSLLSLSLRDLFLPPRIIGERTQVYKR